MKKLTIAFLLSLSCACALAAVGCKDSSDNSASGNSSNAAGKTVNVEFTEGEGYTFLCDIGKEDAKTGTALSFSVKRSAFYTGDPVVYMNGEPLAYVEKSSSLVWEYSVELTEDVTFTVAESSIRKDVSNMTGSGAMDDAFVISKPVDLLYIAQQVNAGVRTYCAGAYVLGADIDCGGETLEVIGDGSTANSFFSGCVSCVVDTDNGDVLEKYAIRNFKISTDDVNNVGLFGTVLADPSVASSGLFYGIRLDDFSITATSASLPESDRSIVAGSLIGYGQGANMYLCESTNGEINVVGDNSYFSFVGGLIGYQQGVYMSAYSAFFPSEITYATVDVDVNILSGLSLYAGGITGYLASNYPLGSTAFIHNSIATGSVSGALRAGGLVGGLGRYTSVGNCYATGEVSAYNSQSVKDPLISSTEYCYAYAGGLVGYAENDTIVNDSFYTGKAEAIARSGAAYANADDYVGGGAPQGSASAISQKYIVDTCVSGDEIVLSNIAYFTNTLGWQDYDWVFTANKLPEIEYDTADASVIAPKATMTLRYVAADGTKIQMDKEDSKALTYFDATSVSANSYVPMGNFFYNGALAFYLASDSVNGVNYLSYGYYLDEACTKKVPYSYVPTKNITLYIGFADASDICGEYTYVNGNKAVTLNLRTDGTVTYTDGNTTQTSYFLYDGETLIVEGARLARYYNGEIVVEDDDVMVTENFDMYRYNYYDYCGGVQDGTLTLYDGIYFTADDPFVAKTGVTLENEYDEFRGEWTKNASVNKFYSFDGKGNWTYSHAYYDRSNSLEKQILEETQGTYTYNATEKTLVLNNGATARFNSYGFLEITSDGETETYYASESYVGSWTNNGLTLVLEGIGSLGYGNAFVTYASGTTYELVYEKSETDGYVALYMPHEEYVKDLLFGYFTYDVNYNVLSSVLYSLGSEAEYEAMTLFLVDDYNGEWIGDLGDFDELDFNGNGLYGFLYGGTSGSVTITSLDGKKTTVPYSLDSTLNGSFVYNGDIYLLSYSETTATVTLRLNDVAVEMNRKDIFANIDFVDLSGNYYKFNGKSTLGKGAFTVTSDSLAPATYRYAQSATGFDVLSGDRVVGQIVKTATCYELTINGVKQQLYVKNEFMGNWAISGKFDTFRIGATNLKGEIMAEFDGNDVVMSYLSPSMLTFFYRDKKNNMPITYYVYLIPDESTGRTVLVLSEYTDLYSGEYTICAPSNELYGKWTQVDEKGDYKDRAICFDGVTSGYVNGVSKITNKFGETLYYYTIREKGIMMWSQDLLAGRTVYYKVKMIDKSEYTAEQLAGAYVLEDKAFFLIEIDGLFLTEATDKDDNVYFFDGEGNLEVNGKVKYTYTVLSYNTGNTVSLHITEIATGKTYEAAIDYSDSSNVLFTIFEEVIS